MQGGRFLQNNDNGCDFNHKDKKIFAIHAKDSTIISNIDFLDPSFGDHLL